jgi:hypothetical protein
MQTKIMAHIREYIKADGTTIYKAEIVVKKEGIVIHKESKAFDKTDPEKLENAGILYENSDKIADVGRRKFFSHIAAKRNVLGKI